ncbi:MAG: hypothetical protein J7L77_06465, partial [Clostridiales bacterium]|nr:hypothetical protein [Clostridiales bacterium]
FKKMQKWILVTGALANVVFLFLLEKGEVIIGGFKAPYGINLILDNYSMAGLVLIGTLFLVGMLLSLDKVGEYSPILLTALAGLNGMLLTGDMFNLFVFMEITAISAYILSMKGGKPEHSFNYLVLGSIGSVFYLMGLIVLYSMTGTLNIRVMAEMLKGADSSVTLIPFFLIFLGVAVEAKLIPFGGWVKGVYGNSNRLTGALFSSVYAGTILFVFGRLFMNVLGQNATISMIMVIIGLATFAFGEAAAFRQTKMRRILLYSSIGQSGLAVTLFSIGLIFPAVVVLANNIIGKFIMFSVAGKLEETYETENYTKLKGAFYKNKLIGIAFSTVALSLIGLPLFFGFYAKMNALSALFGGGNYFIPIVILLLTIVEGAYFIRLIIALWAPGKEGQYTDKKYAVGENKLYGIGKSILIFVLSMVILVAGLVPDFAGKVISSGNGPLNDDGPAFTMSQLKGEE